MTPKELLERFTGKELIEGFTWARKASSWMSTTGEVLVGATLFHFLGWWGVVGGVGLWLVVKGFLIQRMVAPLEHAANEKLESEIQEAGEAVLEHIHRQAERARKM